MRALSHVAALAFISAVSLSAPASSAPATRSASSPLVLEDFFRGPLTAEGTFTATFGGDVRGLKVKMQGTWDRKRQVLTLVEDFVFSDGEKDRKTWRFTKVAPGRYTGTREDVLGEASVVQDGSSIRLAYKARLTTKSGSSFDVAFDDVLVPVNAKTVHNTARVSWLVFPVGNVDLTITRAAR